MAVIPAALLASAGAKQVRKISEQRLGFDFIPLLTSLFLFYSIAFVFAKFMEAVKFATGGWLAIANFIGIKIPSTEELPSTWNQLFDEAGYKGIKWWDLVNVVAILIVIATAFNFQKSVEASGNGNKVSYITWAIFAMIAGFIIVTGVTKLVVKLQERNLQWENK